MNISVIVGILGGIALILLVSRTGVFAFLYDAKAEEYGIDFVLFRLLKIYTLPYSGIESVRDVGFGQMLMAIAVNFSNRSLTNGFLIRTKSGWFTRQILITPAHPTEFKNILQQAGVECEE